MSHYVACLDVWAPAVREVVRRTAPPELDLRFATSYDEAEQMALVDALVAGKLRGAGLDAFDPEPPAKDNPLLTLDQVIATPHTGGAVFDNVENVARHAIGNILRFLRGEPLAPADVVISVKGDAK